MLRAQSSWPQQDSPLILAWSDWTVIATVGAHSSSHRLPGGSFSPHFHPHAAPCCAELTSGAGMEGERDKRWLMFL